MEDLTLRDMVDAGAHLGHVTHKWNPKMSRYIFGSKQGIHIIDVQKTISLFQQACEFVRNIAARGDKVLFVGTKPQAQAVVKEVAAGSGMAYVNLRWLGGTLTNYNTIKKCIDQIKSLTQMEREGFSPGLTKKEIQRLVTKRKKMQETLEGVLGLDRLPGALMVVDCTKERIAVREAIRLKIPVVALVDTNSDPDEVAYPIPANDDSVRSIRLFLTRMGEAIQAGKQLFEESLIEQRKSAEPEVQVAQTTIAGVKVERGKVRMRRSIEELIAAYDGSQESDRS
ncbi:MAG: 30S ribosomal protein S2 [Nitrospirae bacterium]|nr:30S ribosomal protein S2 [Nitrospirota bacterium]